MAMASAIVTMAIAMAMWLVLWLLRLGNNYELSRNYPQYNWTSPRGK